MAPKIEKLGEPLRTDNLSGNAYVVVWPIDAPKTERVVISGDEKRCPHGIRVCTNVHECLESWQYDYVFLFERTAGGRALLKKVGQQADRRIKTLIDAFADVGYDTFMSVEEIVTKAESVPQWRLPPGYLVDRLLHREPIPGFRSVRRDDKFGAMKVQEETQG